LKIPKSIAGRTKLPRGPHVFETLKCATSQYHQTICVVKSHLVHLQHSKTLGKNENKAKHWN